MIAICSSTSNRYSCSNKNKDFGFDMRPWDLVKKTILIIWNEEMDSIIKTIKHLEKPSLLIKGISETMKNEGKEQK